MTEEEKRIRREKMLRRANTGGYFSSHVGVIYDSVTEREARAHFTAQQYHCNPYGIVHGGVYYTMMDQLTGMAAGATGVPCVTIDSSVSYLHSAKLGDTVTCQVECVHLGRSVAVYEGKCWGEDGSVQCTGVFHLFFRQSLEGKAPL